jgi:hypothetical protein
MHLSNHYPNLKVYHGSILVSAVQYLTSQEFLNAPVLTALGLEMRIERMIAQHTFEERMNAPGPAFQSRFEMVFPKTMLMTFIKDRGAESLAETIRTGDLDYAKRSLWRNLDEIHYENRTTGQKVRDLFKGFF